MQFCSLNGPAHSLPVNSWIGEDGAPMETRLEALASSADKVPTFQIKGRKLRNPTLPELNKTLARVGLFDAGLVHDKKSQRFVRYMAPTDVFVSYSWQGDSMVLGDIEVGPTDFGSGLGERFATKVFEHLENAKHEIHLTSPFLRRVGATLVNWRKIFNLEAKT